MNAVPAIAMLHEGGWDEVLMVGVGLVLAYAIIMMTGRKDRDGDDVDGVLDDEERALPEQHALPDERGDARR